MARRAQGGARTVEGGGAMRLEPTEDGFVIDAADLGPLLGLPPAEVPRLMREGQITTLSETGEGEDSGRFRVTFRHGAVRVRFTVDAEGRVLTQSRTDATGARGRPADTAPGQR